MKTIVLLAALILGSTGTFAQTTQYVSLQASAPGTASLAVSTNDAITIASTVSGTQIFGYTPTGVVKISSLAGAGSGFTNIILSANSTGTTNFLFCTLQIIHAAPSTALPAGTYLPADCVAIPTSTSGNCNVIMESSADLINWTAATPGLYGPGSATNRFFRLRINCQ